MFSPKFLAVISTFYPVGLVYSTCVTEYDKMSFNLTSCGTFL